VSWHPRASPAKCRCRRMTAGPRAACPWRAAAEVQLARAMRKRSRGTALPPEHGDRRDELARRRPAGPRDRRDTVRQTVPHALLPLTPTRPSLQSARGAPEALLRCEDQDAAPRMHRHTWPQRRLHCSDRARRGEERTCRTARRASASEMTSTPRKRSAAGRVQGSELGCCRCRASCAPQGICRLRQVQGRRAAEHLRQTTDCQRMGSESRPNACARARRRSDPSLALARLQRAGRPLPPAARSTCDAPDWQQPRWAALAATLEESFQTRGDAPERPSGPWSRRLTSRTRPKSVQLLRRCPRIDADPRTRLRGSHGRALALARPVAHCRRWRGPGSSSCSSDRHAAARSLRRAGGAPRWQPETRCVVATPCARPVPRRLVSQRPKLRGRRARFAQPRARRRSAARGAAEAATSARPARTS
jgi:hypothetical protein